MGTDRHLDAQLDQESLHQFFSAYQTVSPLKLAELWSVCGMLRLGLIEFLCRVAIRVAPPQSDRELAPLGPLSPRGPARDG